jgi:hypothetical protein
MQPQALSNVTLAEENKAELSGRRWRLNISKMLSKPQAHGKVECSSDRGRRIMNFKQKVALASPHHCRLNLDKAFSISIFGLEL